MQENQGEVYEGSHIADFEMTDESYSIDTTFEPFSANDNIRQQSLSSYTKQPDPLEFEKIHKLASVQDCSMVFDYSMPPDE